MQDFINWMVDNWQFISSIAFSVISFILLLIFRRGRLEVDLPTDIYCELTQLIKDAESLFGAGHGKEKKEYVVTKFNSLHPSGFDYKTFAYVVGPFIEDILQAPQKKGVKDGQRL